MSLKALGSRDAILFIVSCRGTEKKEGGTVMKMEVGGEEEAWGSSSSLLSFRLSQFRRFSQHRNTYELSLLTSAHAEAY